MLEHGLNRKVRLVLGLMTKEPACPWPQQASQPEHLEESATTRQPGTRQKCQHQQHPRSVNSLGIPLLEA